MKYTKTAISVSSLLLLLIVVIVAANKPDNDDPKAKSYNTAISLLAIVGFAGMLYTTRLVLLGEGGAGATNPTIKKIIGGHGSVRL